jgi:hypothetical protein
MGIARCAMNRYGEKLSPVDTSDPELDDEHDRYERVMYGGCGVRFGTFQRRVEIPRSRPRFDLLSFLGLRRNQTKEQG